MAAEHALVDTNILLEATDERRVHHRSAFELLSNGSGLRLCAQVVREYLVVATRPATSGMNGLGLSRRHALENVRALRERMRLVPEEKPLLPALLDLLDAVPCTGKRIHDANLVACAVVHGIRRLVTLNARDFAAFSAYVTVLDPTEAA
jgi:predicted nucleic acid-binding protein